MASFKYLLAVTLALIGTAHAAPSVESRQLPVNLPPLGWTYIGCWSDNPGARTLKGASRSDATMTVENCATFCKTGNWNVAGLEFGVECYCGNIFDNAPTAIASSSCVTPCPGNSLENCGGSKALNVYRQGV